MFYVILLMPPWGGAPMRFAGLTERGVRHLETVGWKRVPDGKPAADSPDTRSGRAA